MRKYLYSLITHMFLDEFRFLIYVCYLPPENCSYNKEKNIDAFYAHLTKEVYLNTLVDVIVFCGAFNRRIADQCDFIQGVDTITARSALDTERNGHGDSLLDFVKYCKFWLMNGRVIVNMIIIHVSLTKVNPGKFRPVYTCYHIDSIIFQVYMFRIDVDVVTCSLIQVELKFQHELRALMIYTDIAWQTCNPYRYDASNKLYISQKVVPAIVLTLSLTGTVLAM